MLGKDLKYLANVADISRLEFESAGLTFICENSTVTAIYVGGYNGGWRKITDDSVPDFRVSVSAAKIKQIAALFNDEETVVLAPRESGVNIKGRDSNVTLPDRYDANQNEISDVTPETLSDVEFAVRLSSTKLIDEFSIAETFTAEQATRPILQGVRMEIDKKGINMVTFDGYGMAYKSSLECKTVGSGWIVLPAKDLTLGLRLVGGSATDLTMIRPTGAGTVVIYNQDKSAMFRCSSLMGQWPDLEKVFQESGYGVELELSVDQIRTLVAAGRAFDAAEVTMKPAKNRTVFSIDTQEMGGYQVAIKGTIEQPVAYELRAFDRLSHLGDRITITIPPTHDVPTLVLSGKRRVWMVARN